MGAGETTTSDTEGVIARGRRPSPDRMTVVPTESKCTRPLHFGNRRSEIPGRGWEVCAAPSQDRNRRPPTGMARVSGDASG